MEGNRNMYLPNKIIKELTKINKPYTVYYRGGKISSVETDEKDVRIFSTNLGCCISIKGSEVNLRDLDSLGKLLIKFNIVSKGAKAGRINLKENISELFADSKKQFAAEYYKGELLSLLIEDSNIRIRKTSAGYSLKMGQKDIAVEDLKSLRKLLEKMNVISPKNKRKVKQEENVESPGVEQLTLQI